MKWISPFVAATFEVPMRAPPTEVICTNTTTLFYFLSKIREKHQVYSHILKVDESPHFYSGTPLKYAHMIQSKHFFVLAVCSAPQFILCLKQQAIAYVPLRWPISF